MTATASPALSERDIQRLLQDALAALNKNDPGAAEMALLRVLEADPAQYDALQLMGLLRRAQRRTGEAEDFYRRSLAAKPDQPHVHHNLGNLLSAMGRHGEAAQAQREAIRLKPNYTEAHFALGQAMQSQNDPQGAEKAFLAALRIQPNYMPAKQSLGAVLTRLGRPQEAETLMRQALEASRANPRQSAALYHNLGGALMQQKRYGEALDALDKATALAPDVGPIQYRRGIVLEQLNRLDDALESYRFAVQRDPLDLAVHRDLNQLLYRMGRNEEFLRSYDEASALYPELGELPLNKAGFLFAMNELDQARDVYEMTSRLLPDNVMPLDGLGLVHARLGNFDEAVRAHERAVTLEPDNVQAWSNFAETLIRAGDARKAIATAQRALQIEPDNQHALGMWGLALRKAGDAQEEVLNDYENFVQVFELEIPRGFSNIEDFNRELDAFLNGFHVAKREYLAQSLRGGTQTVADLFGEGHDLIERLRESVDKAVAAYIARMKQDEAHPLLRRKAPGFLYSGSWSSRLRDCGFHINHVHPKGWISSAYYIAVPDAVNDPEQKQGWIKFGEPDFDLGVKDPIRRAIQPRAGTLVLFPSYMWHGTVPFHSAASRTTIAFDAVPK